MWIVTGSVSVANPVNEGVVLLDGDLTPFKITVGGDVSMVNVTGLLLPVGFPSELGCVAIALYSPADSAGLASPELQPPPVPGAVAPETGLPSALLPL